MYYFSSIFDLSFDIKHGSPRSNKIIKDGHSDIFLLQYPTEDYITLGILKLVQYKYKKNNINGLYKNKSIKNIIVYRLHGKQ